MAQSNKTPKCSDGKKKLKIPPSELPKATGTSNTDLQFHLVNQMMETLWIPAGTPDAERVQAAKAAIAVLDGIKPRDEIEGLLGVQMVACHNASMECLRRAMAAKISPEERDQNLKHAIKFLGVYTRQMEALAKHRGKGEQKISVEHVNVHDGGQAIVGNVGQPANDTPAECKPKALENKSDAVMPPIETKETVKQTVRRK